MINYLVIVGKFVFPGFAFEMLIINLSSSPVYGSSPHF